MCRCMCVFVCMSEFVSVYMHVCLCIFVYVAVYVWVCLCMRTRVCVYVCVFFFFLFMCVFKCVWGVCVCAGLVLAYLSVRMLFQDSTMAYRNLCQSTMSKWQDLMRGSVHYIHLC